MGLKIRNFFLLTILILLQSCSGGRIGNFFETSFKDIEEQKIKEDNKNNLKNEIVIKSDQKEEKNKNKEEQKIKEDDNANKKTLIRTDKKLKINKKVIRQSISSKKRQYQPQSYKIIFILKDVDPKDPIEDLRTILRNSDVNFEIEKIERFFDSKNKNIKNN